MRARRRRRRARSAASCEAARAVKRRPAGALRPEAWRSGKRPHRSLLPLSLVDRCPSPALGELALPWPSTHTHQPAPPHDVPLAVGCECARRRTVGPPRAMWLVQLEFARDGPFIIAISISKWSWEGHRVACGIGITLPPLASGPRGNMHWGDASAVPPRPSLIGGGVSGSPPQHTPQRRERRQLRDCQVSRRRRSWHRRAASAPRVSSERNTKITWWWKRCTGSEDARLVSLLSFTPSFLSLLLLRRRRHSTQQKKIDCAKKKKIMMFSLLVSPKQLSLHGDARQRVRTMNFPRYFFSQTNEL